MNNWANGFDPAVHINKLEATIAQQQARIEATETELHAVGQMYLVSQLDLQAEREKSARHASDANDAVARVAQLEREKNGLEEALKDGMAIAVRHELATVDKRLRPGKYQDWYDKASRALTTQAPEAKQVDTGCTRCSVQWRASWPDYRRACPNLDCPDPLRYTIRQAPEAGQ